MGEDNKNEKLKIASDIQDDIAKHIEKAVSGEVESIAKKEIDKKINHHIEKKIDQHIDRALGEEIKKAQRSMMQDFYDFQEKLRYHRVIYGFLVVTGFLLFWFGTWRIMSHIPAFDNGLIPTFLGIFLMSLTGTLYWKLVGEK